MGSIQNKSLKDLKNKKLLQTKGYINGEWCDAKSGRTFEVVDPATGDTIATLPEMGKEDTARAIDAAYEAFQTWKMTDGRTRARLLRKWNDLCIANADDLALILTLENGKPLPEAKGEVLYGTSFIEWFAGEAERQIYTRTYGENIPTANRNQRIVTTKQPVGVVGCLTPWNFPIAMITRKACAGIAAGCTTVWKPAGETPLSALAQAVLALEAGIPPGVIQVVTTLTTVAEVGKEICTNPKVKKVSFTGSTRVGRILMEQGSSTIKKLSLELGGNSPFIVFNDAKLETAVEAGITAKFRNSGQTCVTANRIFVQSGIYEDFAKALTAKIKTLKVGPGTEDGVYIGPLTHENAVAKAVHHIDEAKKAGGEIILGGGAVDGKPGFFLQPTVIKNMPRDTINATEETFAPVVPLYKFETEEEVLKLANSVDVGLGSFIMTENMPRMWRVAEALEVGMVGINIGMLSACENPFGGVKQSGFGREGGRQGIEEYLALKSMFFNVAG